MIKVKVFADELRERPNPSGRWNGKYIPLGTYIVLNRMEYDGREWLQVKDEETGYVWIAVDSEWNKVYEEEEMYQDKYEELLALINDFLDSTKEATSLTVDKFKEEINK